MRYVCGMLLLLAALPLGLRAQSTIIPQPVKTLRGMGSYTLSDHAVIATDAESRPAAVYLQAYLAKYYKLQLDLQDITLASHAVIQLRSKNTDQKESYALQINAGGVHISGAAAGVFYGVQSLIQLLPDSSAQGLSLTACTITDAPRFGWRGLSLDVSRHFFTVGEVKQYIDIMAHYKLNVLHWHLTDDEGWRIQIDKYPKLTEVGARMSYYAKRGEFRPLDNLVDEGRDGFYTKADIREVLQYAQERFVTILPEIEMPGHSEAAIFAYPELGCQDSTGAKHRVTMLDPGEYTFTFMENVLSEVIDLFPNPYIHIGGDEAQMKAWLKSPVAVALMKKEGLQQVQEVQSYFIKRIEKYLLSRNKKLIGWDEILQGGLAQSATVMSWRGEAGGIAAAKMHHPVIMTPLPQMYFDAPQANEALEPIGWNPPVPWQMVYNYDPVPAALTTTEAAYVLGVQGNIWAEKIPNLAHLEYMVYPRAVALSEIAWTPKKDRNIARFEGNLYKQYRFFKMWNVNARLPDMKGMTSITTNLPKVNLTLSYPLKDVVVRYSLNAAWPDSSAPAQHFPVKIFAPLTDTLSLKATTSWTLNGQRIRQEAMMKHVSLAMAFADATPLERGWKFQRYVVPEENDRPLDSLVADSSGVMQLAAYLPATGDQLVKAVSYLRIDVPGDYTILSRMENSPAVYLDNQCIIAGDQDCYVAPQKAVLHLKPGYYAIRLVYRRTDKGALLQVISPAGKLLDLATRCVM